MALSTQRASASFLSNESTPPWEYDVFLSFRGVDTRKGFVSHLYGELCKWQGIRTFFDDRELEGGSGIRLELPSAIKNSNTAIVVLSPSYASSKWCLDELTKILQCMEARKSVLPVFYETDPSDVGNQKGSFAEAFEKHEKNLISKEKVVQWKAGLKRVSKIAGKHRKNFKCDRELIEDIVKWVWMKVQATFTLSDSSRKLVGTDYAFEQLSLLLAHDANDVRFIGITGMGGIGKTTLANLVYDKIRHDFEVHCFLANVREVFAKNGMVDLAKKLLFPFLRERIAEIWDEERVSILIEKFLHNKKVLLVLDDVDELKQLEVLAGNQGWFGLGSRIVVTTRNQRLLVQHDIETSYQVQGLNDAEALKLFSLHAFKKDQPEEDFLELSKYFINYARGLPLALITFGSALFKRGLDAWISERDSLSKILNPTIFDKLKISYDRLEEREKSIFLDVACFHKGKYTEQVIETLRNYHPFGMSSRIVIDVLIERSLLYQDHDCIRMHDLIQEMAWKIIGDESKAPGLRSRLWLYEDIIRVLTTNTGTGAIEAISLCLPKVEEVRQWNWEAFSKLHGLRFLKFNNLIFSSSPEFLPCSLRTINWSFYPSKFLPTSFQLRFLTELVMRGSKLVRLWEGKMDLPNLKYINLEWSNKLKSTPDFSGLPSLEMLHLKNCENLVEMHPTIAVLKRLKVLDLRWCESIKSLPSKVEMDSLELFLLNGCSNVEKIPEFEEQMKNVSRIYLREMAVKEIPSSIGHLVGLEELHLDNCKNLKKIPEFGEQMKNLWRINLSGSAIEEIPSSIGHLVGLKELHLYDCKNLKKIQEFGEQMKNLWQINLSGSAIEEIPSSIGHLVGLKKLDLDDCKNLKKIQEFGEQMKNLGWIYLSGSAIEEIPSSIGHLVGLQELHLDDCKNLKKIPEFGEQMKNLWQINLSGSAIEEIPSSIGHLVGLQMLYLDNCKNLKKIPEFGEEMKNLGRIKLSGSAIEEIPSSIGHLVRNKSRPNPPRWGVVLSSLNHLCSLIELSLRDCELYEGDIPDDIGCLSSLEELDLSGNNFVSLPESIRCLSKLELFALERCKSLQELPPLPSERYLRVKVENCTSLKRLLDPSKMMSRYTYSDGTECKEFFCYTFFCLNNIALAQDEGWINTILSTILKFATQRYVLDAREIVIPGSEIPGWFGNQSVGHSVNLDLPPPSCTDWLGIAFCVVFEDPKQNLVNPPALPHLDNFSIRARGIDISVTYKIGSLMSEHLWVFYLDREDCYQEQCLFETYIDGFGERGPPNFGAFRKRPGVKADLNTVKKCGARLLYKQDLEELNQTLKILKRKHEYRDEAAPIGPESPSFNDTEQIRKRHCY